MRRTPRQHSQIIRVISLLLIVVAVSLLLTATHATSYIEIESNAVTTSSKMRPEFPSHWGSPPRIQTRDLVQLPGNYGKGSGTLRNWILQKMAEDEQRSDTRETTTKWPELSLVGMTGEEAQNAIRAVDDTLEVRIVPEGSMVTMDYRLDRVRIYVDEENRVVRQPKRG
ncbi:hypothetical protein HJC23_002687 [Cyclotella cryptica]|uniref:Uncharacterized protein n=1 Tax=Cyclotella cryptica TaxID=29204 RepID=A0ABD3NTM9_9STRA